MTTDAQPLAVRDDQPLVLSPREVISNAKEQAEVLMEVVKAKKLYAPIGDKMYLEAEAWEIILSFNKVAPVPEYVKPIYEDDKVVAYEAKVNLIDQNGVIRGAGIAECSIEGSFSTKGRVGRDRDKSAKSTAQTWAMSKAARMAFSWVAVLAGFEPTPASEMKRGPRPDSASTETAEGYGICEKHDVPYFKRGAMTSPGHKDDTTNGKWCNRPDDDAEFAAKAPGSPTELVAESEPPHGLQDREYAPGDGPTDAELHQGEPESDGGPPLFPPEQASKSSEAKPRRHFATIGALRAALVKDFGLGTKALQDKALGESLDGFGGTLDVIYETIEHNLAANTEA